ncbi:hypothetical protein SGRIM128S_03491 [Streptomyces griseomycini]
MSEQARLRASSVSSACIAASTPFCAQRPSLRVSAPSRTVTRGIARSLPVLGLRDAVGGAVEPVDAQQGLPRVGLGAFAQSLDEGRVVDGDAGP